MLSTYLLEKKNYTHTQVFKRSLELPVRQKYKDPTLNGLLCGLLESPPHFYDNNNDDSGS